MNNIRKRDSYIKKNVLGVIAKLKSKAKIESG